MPDFLTLHEIVKAARAALDDGVWDYLVGGTESEATLLRNRLALDGLALVPRVLRDVREIDPSTTFLGAPLRLPVLLAPIGSLQSLHATGALGAARGAAAFGVASTLSSATEPGIEEVAGGTDHPKIYQLYVRGDRAWVEERLQRAVDLGYHALCLTLDLALYSRRERDLIKRYIPTARRNPEGMEYQAGMTWEMIDWVMERFPLPLVLKGVAHREDAARAAEAGVAAVWVSNHGGRALDHGPGALDLLPDIAAAVAGRTEIVVDGGVLRGTDVLKSLALGADAVAIGRLYGFGLAAAGEAGVVRTLKILEEEIVTAMGLLGVARIDELDASYVRPAPPPRPWTDPLASAFPHLQLPRIHY